MVFAASMPFITGIITSMRTASNVSGGLFCTISTACLPSVTTVTVAPFVGQQNLCDFGVERIVPDEQQLAACNAAIRRGMCVRCLLGETVQFQTAK